jgi:hypothetical protein
MEEKGDQQTTFTYRFGFIGKSDVAVPDFVSLTSFSGGATKVSAMTEKVLSWDLVPLEGLWSRVPLTCDALLPGVPTVQERATLRGYQVK